MAGGYVARRGKVIQTRGDILPGFFFRLGGWNRFGACRSVEYVGRECVGEASFGFAKSPWLGVRNGKEPRLFRCEKQGSFPFFGFLGPGQAVWA